MKAKMKGQALDSGRIGRRSFVKLTGLTALGATSLAFSAPGRNGVTFVCDSTDRQVASGPVQWALNELKERLTARAIKVSCCEKIDGAPAGELLLVVAGLASPPAGALLQTAQTVVPAVPESLGLVPVRSAGRQLLLACGSDERGLVYALLELADRVSHATQPLDAFHFPRPVVERPANRIRSVARLFVSDVEDKPWYNDRAMWPNYLTMLATQRFNRFNLSFGIGYDFLQNVTDGYFVFSYPFLLSVPGYQVRVPQLPDAERDRNLEMLRYISEQTAARGLRFQLGLWMHGYEWLNSPNPNYTIEGLTKENHGPYCRDAVRELLKACPAIGGITFRIHGESGVTEGSYNFWKSVFDGVATCGRTVEIDMHAKGMDQTMIDLAAATGLPVNISPKYWAEHLGMPYHQTDIRPLEIPKPGAKTSGLMNLSAGSRSFIRYGYGDLLKEDRPYGVLHRIWPGTQRLLLWGDPKVSAAHARAFSFCGSAGVELMEPLSFKGRRGSGLAGDRCGYADASLRPRWDWKKYLYSYRIFGRLAYSPDTQPEVWRRYLNRQFGSAAGAVEAALANATRILPIVLTAHGPSAANNNYWPEMYTNQSIHDPGRKSPYSDTLSPKTFGNVSPFDPQLFLRINDFADELLKGERSGKYTPVEYAQWIEDYADAAAKSLAEAESAEKEKSRPEFRRMAVDVAITVGLGRFFAAKFRAAVLYGIFDQSGSRAALEASLTYYQKARGFWAGLAERARGVYQSDITVGEKPDLRGHWIDRLPAIDEDIATLADKLKQLPATGETPNERLRRAIEEATGRPKRPSAACRHTPPESFKAGQPLALEFAFDQPPGSAQLYYRRVNQAERFESVDLHRSGNSYRGIIPSACTNSPYPVQYYVELKETPNRAWIYPGFAPDLMNQPYFVVRQKLG